MTQDRWYALMLAPLLLYIAAWIGLFAFIPFCWITVAFDVAPTQCYQ